MLLLIVVCIVGIVIFIVNVRMVGIKVNVDFFIILRFILLNKIYVLL